MLNYASSKFKNNLLSEDPRKDNEKIVYLRITVDAFRRRLRPVENGMLLALPKRGEYTIATVVR